ncbi:hypothetical protein BBJ28_00017716 [Nothophytophthora sp. Chile5]|nr:hypothetical protein BBJ28_00017716 [Nothophytophthora sp. Chile5]
MSMTDTSASIGAQPPAQDPALDAKFASSMGFVVALMRAIESDREDRIVHDPFAEPLTRQVRPMLMPLMESWAQQVQHPSNFLGIRTRYQDETLNHRNQEIRQFVLLGAGFDARAYYLESLRGCHVFEIDQSARIFAHKKQVMQDLGASLVADKLDYIVADLLEGDWQKKLLESGFDPAIPTFWSMEGLLMYLDRDSDVALLKTVDSLSAPGSALWADMSGEALLRKEAEQDTMKPVDSLKDERKGMFSHGEDDPLRGVLSEIPWQLELQASMATAGTHFGREWTPSLAGSSKEPVALTIVTGTKSAP